MIPISITIVIVMGVVMCVDKICTCTLACNKNNEERWAERRTATDMDVKVAQAEKQAVLDTIHALKGVDISDLED